MTKRSSRNLRHWNGRNDVAIAPSKNAHRSTRSYKLLVIIVYATGILDWVVSWLLLSCCSKMLETLRELEEFNRLFPYFTAQLSKLLTDMAANLIGLGDDEALNLADHQEILDMAIMISKASFVLILGIALFFLILSTILFRGISKKNSTYCHIWNVCLCMSLIIYFMLALIVSVFNFFQLSPQMWIMVYSYGFYRFGTIYTVYIFQQRFLFISNANVEAINYYGDE